MGVLLLIDKADWTIL